MEIIGKIKQVMALVQGQNEAGDWCRREIVITTVGDDAADICISFFGERAVRKLETVKVGDLVQAFARVRSRQGKMGDRWFTTVEGNGVNLLRRDSAGEQAAMQMETDDDVPLPY